VNVLERIKWAITSQISLLLIVLIGISYLAIFLIDQSYRSRITEMANVSVSLSEPSSTRVVFNVESKSEYVGAVVLELNTDFTSEIFSEFNEDKINDVYLQVSNRDSTVISASTNRDRAENIQHHLFPLVNYVFDIEEEGSYELYVKVNRAGPLLERYKPTIKIYSKPMHYNEAGDFLANISLYFWSVLLVGYLFMVVFFSNKKTPFQQI